MTSSSRVLRAVAMARASCTRARTMRVVALILATAVAGCGATGGTDRPEQDATVMLHGPRSAVPAAIASAIARGYDEAEGVTLKLLGGAATPRDLTTGKTTFAVLDLNELAARKDVVAVMAIAQQPLLAFTTPERGIRAPWARRFGRPVRRWDLHP